MIKDERDEKGLWIGLYSIRSDSSNKRRRKYGYIAYYDYDRNWMWTDNGKNEYTHWVPGQPSPFDEDDNDYVSTEECPTGHL